MKSKATALEEAQATLEALSIPSMLSELDALGLRLRRTLLGGSHSVAVYPPIDSLTPIDDGGALIESLEPASSGVSLYVHVAFCETRCTFCHYAVERYSPSRRNGDREDEGVERYLEALTSELTFWGKRLVREGSIVTSIYIGGGTPLILSQTSLGRIFDTIDREFLVSPDAEVCVEGSPLTITAPDGEEKLQFLRSRGVARLSFGVQSFDNDVLKYAARGYGRELPIRAAAIVARVFDNWNMDMIQGLYKGSPSESWNNLAAVSEILPPHLTWYHARFGDRPQARWRSDSHKQQDFEDDWSTLLGRLLIWQELAALGYRQCDGNRFVRQSEQVDRFKRARTTVLGCLIGVGAASYSHSPVHDPGPERRGFVFRNEPRIPSYVATVLDGSAPVTAARVIDDAEVLASSYATGLRNGRVEDADLQAIGKRIPEIASCYATLASRLTESGVLEADVDDGGQRCLGFSRRGRLFEDETLALFFSPAVMKALGALAPM